MMQVEALVAEEDQGAMPAHEWWRGGVMLVVYFGQSKRSVHDVMLC